MIDATQLRTTVNRVIVPSRVNKTRQELTEVKLKEQKRDDVCLCTRVLSLQLSSLSVGCSPQSAVFFHLARYDCGRFGLGMELGLGFLVLRSSIDDVDPAYVSCRSKVGIVYLDLHSLGRIEETRTRSRFHGDIYATGSTLACWQGFPRHSQYCRLFLYRKIHSCVA